MFEQDKVRPGYSYGIYLLALLGIIALVFFSNIEPVAKVSANSSSRISETISKAQTLIDSNFDFEEEKRLTDLLNKNSAPPPLDAVAKEIISVNKKNLEKLLRGEKMQSKLSVRAEPLTSDMEQAWATIETSLKGMKAYKNGGVAQFKQALENYEKGMSLKQFPADERGNIYLKEAGRKFVQILKSNPVPVIREYSLYFLGDIGFHLWDEGQDLPGAAYMIELVRSTGSSDLAQKAWLQLNAQIHFGYTGSGGDHTPPSWKRFLAQLQGLTIKQHDFPLISRVSE